MRNMLERQRKRMRRLARFLREERDNQDNEEQRREEERESFMEVVTEPLALEESQVGRAIDELGRTARMLDVLDEMLAMQDYTISQIGTFSQG